MHGEALGTAAAAARALAQLSPRGPLRLVERPPATPFPLDSYYAHAFALEREYCREAQAAESARRGRPLDFSCDRVGSLVQLCPAAGYAYACSWL